MKNSLFLSFEIMVYQILFIFFSASPCNIPHEYSSAENMEVFRSLKITVVRELHIVEYTKNIGYNTTSESISIVLLNDETITEASEKYDVPKPMIQAVLFKELRMIDFRDGISDFYVDTCFRINRNMSHVQKKNEFCRLINAITNTKGSSTGIGQIFPGTAIKAYNWYYGTKDCGGACINYEDPRQREEVWRALQDEKTSIDFIALILKYESEVNLNIDIENASEDDIKNLFVRYNGAEYYGDEVFKYYSLFREVKPA